MASTAGGLGALAGGLGAGEDRNSLVVVGEFEFARQLPVIVYAVWCGHTRLVGMRMRRDASRMRVRTFDLIKFRKSMSNVSSEDPVISVPILSQAKCLGYLWSKSLSARAAVEENIAKARRKFFCSAWFHGLLSRPFQPPFCKNYRRNLCDAHSAVWCRKLDP